MKIFNHLSYIYISKYSTLFLYDIYLNVKMTEDFNVDEHIGSPGSKHTFFFFFKRIFETQAEYSFWRIKKKLWSKWCTKILQNLYTTMIRDGWLQLACWIQINPRTPHVGFTTSIANETFEERGEFSKSDIN